MCPHCTTDKKTVQDLSLSFPSVYVILFSPGRHSVRPLYHFNYTVSMQTKRYISHFRSLLSGHKPDNENMPIQEIRVMPLTHLRDVLR